MKIKYPINLHKLLTFALILGLMVIHQNFTLAPWVYLALHGTYGIMWLIKDIAFPNLVRYRQETKLFYQQCSGITRCTSLA